MKILRDLRCPACEALYLDELCEGDHRCVCGAVTTTYYGAQALLAGGTERKADAFSPITFGGVRYESREAWSSFRQEWRGRHHEELHVEGDSPAIRKAKLEESHHRSITEARRRGMHGTADNIERAGARIR